MDYFDIFQEGTDDLQERLDTKKAQVAGSLVGLIASLGLSHTSVAEAAGIKRPQLSRQLSGDANLTIETISRICFAVGVDFSLAFKQQARAQEPQVEVYEWRNCALFEKETVAAKPFEMAAKTILQIAKHAKESSSYILDVNGQSGTMSMSTECANEQFSNEPTQSLAA